ncbi:MAG: hypothetical protein AAF560_29550, partial [Acidobacteriota bacterium]
RSWAPTRPSRPRWPHGNSSTSTCATSFPTLPIRGAKSLRTKLDEQRESALLSRELATIALDAPATADLDELRLDGAMPELVDPLFEELAFGRIRDRITRWKS